MPGRNTSPSESRTGDCRALTVWLDALLGVADRAIVRHTALSTHVRCRRQAKQRAREWVGSPPLVNGDLVRLYFTPLLWLTASVVLMGSILYGGSVRNQARLSRLSPDRVAAYQRTYSNGLMDVWMIAMGLFVAVAGIRALIGGLATWWLWLLAAMVQFGSLLVRRDVKRKLGIVSVRPEVQTSRRQRRVLWFAVPAIACLYGAKPVAAAAARQENGYLGALGILLIVAALAGFVAAGWAAVWSYKDRTTDTESVSPPRL